MLFRSINRVNEYKGVILVVDDTPSNLNVLFSYLRSSGFKVLVAQTGDNALKSAEYTKPDLILLDISMSTLDGYELCSLLRKHSAMKETPIIMVTGKKGIINRVKAKMVKASDYITKPFQKKDLLKVMFKYIV